MSQTCIAVPIPPVPTIPDIFLELPIPPFTISADFCCAFSISDEPAVALAQLVVNTALAAAGGEFNSAIDMVNGEVMAIALPIIKALKRLKIGCPLDGVSP